MSGSHLSLIVMPPVIAIALFSWLAMIFYANAHPGRGRGSTNLTSEVRGGAFRAVEGGRQLMPIPERTPAVPAPRTAAAEESYHDQGASEPAQEPKPLVDLPTR
jgi:hypothetical protein